MYFNRIKYFDEISKYSSGLETSQQYLQILYNMHLVRPVS